MLLYWWVGFSFGFSVIWEWQRRIGDGVRNFDSGLFGLIRGLEKGWEICVFEILFFRFFGVLFFGILLILEFLLIQICFLVRLLKGFFWRYQIKMFRSVRFRVRQIWINIFMFFFIYFRVVMSIKRVILCKVFYV